ncbi:cytochrome P450 4AB9 precursor [Nasonia vitripennis]|uniref:Cytochrome P450 n=1 Tax=Nasonia vitripennis TaxID=7425 RepID=A0A7M6US20_NASVI|nr:cytochrome P450 4AB9 precursor [Nasonia vitripennis]
MIRIFVLLLLLTLIACHIFTRYTRKGRLLNIIPGPAPLPIIGNLLQFAVTSAHDLWKIARKYSTDYYPITRFWTTGLCVVSVRHPDDLEILLNSQKTITKGYIYNYLHSWLKSGLLTSTGDKWRQRRKLLTPAFHFNILKEYLGPMNEEGLRCVDDLKNDGESTIKDLVEFLSESTLNVICESTMGVSLNRIETGLTTRYKKAIHEMGYIVSFRLCRPYIFDWIMNLPWKFGNLQRKSLKILHHFTNKFIQEKKIFNEESKGNYSDVTQHSEDNGEHSGSKKRLAFLDLLLTAKKNNMIDDEGIQEEVDTFTFEGHDTTAMALTFTLMLLAENKEAQEKARAEAKEVLDCSHGKLDVSDVQKLNYLDRCIKESLRLYPPVSTIMRYSADELQLKNALVPADTHIVVNFFDTHRDPNFWPEPNKFDPDRFLPERSVGRHPYAFVPFSAGSRNCIGQKFAMMEMKILIARILYDFRLEPTEHLADGYADIPLLADIVIRPLNKIFTRFIKL